MRISTFVFLMLLCSFQLLLAGVGKSQGLAEKKLTLEIKNEPLRKALNKVGKLSGFKMAYPLEQVNEHRGISIPKATRTVEQTLHEMLTGTDLRFKEGVNNTILIYKGREKKTPSPENHKPESAAPFPSWDDVLKTIKGKVTDETGASLPGANVVVKGTTQGVTTDSEGNYAITLVEESVTLVFSFIGYQSQEVLIGNQAILDVTLSVDIKGMEELVVVGYGAQKKVNMTGAVSSVKTDALSDRPATNATNMLAGLAAGLTVTNSGGNTPGYESQTIRIRGQGTLNNASPLVVIDGMAGASISDINPRDIESISVLKDAASSAIYGSRGANGVILITTKKGAEGTAVITYSGNISAETVARRLNLVTDYADFMGIQNAGLVANGQAPRFSQGKIDEWRNDGGKNPTVYPNTDWQDHIYRNPSFVQNHTISANGGSKTTRYNLSFGHINNPGMIYYTDYKRNQLRANVEVDIKPWLTVGTNLFGYLDSNNPSSGVAAAGGDVIWGYGAFNTVPGMTLYDPETGFYGGIQNPEDENISNANPYRRMWFFKKDFPTRTRRTVSRLYGRIKPVKGLTIDGSYSYNYWDRNVEQHLVDRDLYRFTKEGPVMIREGVVRTYIRKYNYRETFRTSDITARYEHNFNRLSTSVMLGASQEYNKSENELFRRYDLVDESLTAIDAGATDGPVGGNYTEWAMHSYFGRLNLAWDDKYMLEANFRTDGSSKFSPGTRWGYFPSVSAGWNISQERFMDGTRNWLSSLKLRASYGSLGNNSTSSYYMYQSLFSATNYILNNTITGGLSQTVLSNANLTWESSYVTNAGLDYGFLRNRLTGSLDLFSKNTKGILISLPVPLEHGTTVVPNQNAGGVNNRGMDLDLNWSDEIGKVNYTAGFNMGYVRNKVTRFQGDIPSISGVYKIQEGKPINQLYMITVDRIVRDQADLDYVQTLVENNPNYFATYQRPQLGDFLYADANGDGQLDANDRVEIGKGNNPTFTFGANLGLSWKNFNFSMLLQGVGKYQVYYNNQAFRFVTAMGQSLNKDITDHAWTPENPYNSKYPILRNSANGKNNIASDAFLFNGAYLRFKNVQLGYTVPKHISQKFFVEGLKAYASVDNLFTITNFPGLDPEIGANVGYPSLRQYSLGLNLSF